MARTTEYLRELVKRHFQVRASLALLPPAWRLAIIGFCVAADADVGAAILGVSAE